GRPVSGCPQGGHTMAVAEASAGTAGALPVPSESPSLVERLFGVRAQGSTVGIEVRAGITTFMVMAYIIFVNPAILSFAGVKDLEGKGPPFPAVVAATCLVAGVMTLAMGLYANYPLAIAPGMGLNAVVAFQLVPGMGLTWPEAMGVIVLEGLF